MPTRIYDYNYKVGESYYNPQTEFIENRELLSKRKAPPPEAQTYAERFANRPFYGSARGLPYGEEESVSLRPIQRRALSAGRSRASRDREIDDIPSSFRASRGRDRKLSFNIDDFDSDVKTAFKDFSLEDDTDFKPKTKHTFSLVDDSDFRVPRSRRSRDLDERSIADEFTIRPENKTELLKKFKEIEREFQKADSLDRGSTSRKYEHSAWNDELNIPGKKSVKRDDVSYTDPMTGAKVHKSSYQESSKFESSSSSSSARPPTGRPPRPSRLLSVDNDFDVKPLRSRPRRISMSDIDDDLDIRSLASKAISHVRGDDEKKFRGAREMRDLRRAKESEELSTNINKMISKLKRHSDEGDEIKVTRTFRSSSLDPYQKETFVKASPRTRFVYGVSRI